MKTRRFRTVQMPEFSDSKYIVMQGEVFVNASADPGAPILGRFLYSTDDGARRRGR